ncbi:histidine kinase [Streptomyces sp. NBC_00365]|uniref:sensor histidine kinase n=1 Tax=Streptomyces sp. NBC_00365 TaxID=2975726 RepID=UPI00225A448D|nr:histidine kinase [Streptomyces sp. NBC_00365]MCX5091509.1 histidine kinase [Streptomyces sp. NBC_00365]
MSSTTAPTAATAPTGPIASTRAIASAGPIAPAGPPLPVTPTIPLVGSGFGEALHEGLVRAAARLSPRPDHASAMSPATALGSWETGAVLDRFTARLPTALTPAEAEVPALRTTLTEFARTALSRAADTTPAPTPTPIAPPAASPHQVAAAVALLLECALLHVLESGITHRESALPRAVAVVRRLGEVVRGAGEGMWSGDDGRGERRRLARQLHDELGGALSLARLSLDAASTCAPAGTGASASTSPTPSTTDAYGAVAAHLATAQRALAEAARENQALIDGIRHRADLPPLREALEAFLAGPRPRAGRRVQTSVEVIGDEWTLSERHREETFLALREALRDRLARSGAHRVDTVVRITRRWLYAKVTDDGQGPAAGSVGSADRARALRSLTGRVEDLGGRTGITSGTPTGTLLEIHVPLRRRP